jgi:3-oxoacyl-[acyl-carrier protein] reductase
MMPKIALITGASRGIGRGIALELAKHGWTIVINFRNNRVAATETQKKIEELGSTAALIKADITKPRERRKLIKETITLHQKIDLFVNNAGIAPLKRVDLLSITKESFTDVMTANLEGPFFLTQMVANHMIEMVEAGVIKNPKIINISSISAYTSSPSRAEYCLSKAGISMMTNLFADRLAEFGIGVFEIRPGIIETDMTIPVKEKYDRLIMGGLTPIQRWGKPEDVGKAVLAISEGYLTFSTGEIINVDGGFHLRRL